MLEQPRLVSSSPCKIYALKVPSEADRDHNIKTKIEFMLIGHFPDCGYRGVSRDRIHYILKNGIDVTPTDNVIYVGDASKALEYGEWPKVLLALQWKALDRPFRQVPANSPQEKLVEIQKEFPTRLISEDGSSFHFSKLKEGSRGLATYEVDYGYYIPNNPWDALKAIFLMYRPEDEHLFDEFKII